MVDAIDPQPGQTILDLAAGVGDTGFLAAELIQPGGELITSDFAPEMLAAAQSRAQRARRHERPLPPDGPQRPLDQPAACLDAVLCRWGYMLLKDAEAALRETRRMLKHGGAAGARRLDRPRDNLWSAAPCAILHERGLIERPTERARASSPGPTPVSSTSTLEAAASSSREIERASTSPSATRTSTTGGSRRPRPSTRTARRRQADGLRHPQRRPGRAGDARPSPSCSRRRP